MECIAVEASEPTIRVVIEAKASELRRLSSRLKLFEQSMPDVDVGVKEFVRVLDDANRSISMAYTDDVSEEAWGLAR